MKPLLFVVSDPVLGDQLAEVAPSLKRPVTVVRLADNRRGVWDFRKLYELRQTLAAHADGTVHAIGVPAAKVIAVLGVGLKFRSLRLSGALGSSVIRVWNRDFQHVPWPWFAPTGAPAIDRDTTLARWDIPANAFVFATSSRMLRKDEALPPIWGFEASRYPLKDVCLLIHGDGPATMEVLEFARNLAPEGTRVRLAGDAIPRATLFGIADAVMAMNAESLMAGLTARKPIIAPLMFADLLRDNEDALLIDPGVAPMIAKKMYRLAGDAELRVKLAEAAGKMALRYTPDQSARMLEIGRG